MESSNLITFGHSFVENGVLKFRFSASILANILTVIWMLGLPLFLLILYLFIPDQKFLITAVVLFIPFGCIAYSYCGRAGFAFNSNTGQIGFISLLSGDVTYSDKGRVKGFHLEGIGSKTALVAECQHGDITLFMFKRHEGANLENFRKDLISISNFMNVPHHE